MTVFLSGLSPGVLLKPGFDSTLQIRGNSQTITEEPARNCLTDLESFQQPSCFKLR